MSTDSPQVKLIHELVRAFETKDLALFAKYSHDDFRRVNYPRSLGKPDQTKEEWLGGLEKGMSLWTGDGKVGPATVFLLEPFQAWLNSCTTVDRPFDHRSSREGRLPRSFPQKPSDQRCRRTYEVIYPTVQH